MTPIDYHADSHRWRLRYATHLGYRSLAAPLFLHEAGGIDPLKHVRCAARMGFKGVQDVFACEREESEQSALGTALADYGLETGCILYAPMTSVRSPVLTGRSRSPVFIERIRRSLEVARRVRAQHLAVLLASDPDETMPDQRAALVENLKVAADLAQLANVELGLEAIKSPFMPPMVINSLADVIDIMQRVGRPNVRLIFDSAHVEAIEGRAAERLDAVYEYISVVQLADFPGRCEPGTGSIDFVSLLSNLIEREHQGLVELEFNWSKDGLQGEMAGLDRFRAIDAEAGYRADMSRPQDISTEKQL